MKNLYDLIDVARKFEGTPTSIVEGRQPSKAVNEQLNIGLEWASRQAQRDTSEAPVTQMPPIVPVAS